MNRLNGEHYEAPVQLFPVVKRKSKETKIVGTLKRGLQGFHAPVNYGKVALLQGSKVISEVTTDLRGKFIIIGNLKDGTYSLIGSHGQKRTIRRLEVSGYFVGGIELLID